MIFFVDTAYLPTTIIYDADRKRYLNAVRESVRRIEFGWKSWWPR